ncbi:MAG: ester cyclase [Cyclobacteriaceae bacterium]
MSRKEIAQTFLKLAGTGAVEEAFAKFAGANFIHHNQYFEGSGASLKQAMQQDHESNPNESIAIKYCYEDADTVVTHSLVVKKEMQIAVVHIFRFEGDKIAELWDLGQPIEKDSPNQYGLF